MSPSIHVPTRVACVIFHRLATALLPIMACYQLSPPENKTFIFQLNILNLKALCSLFVPFTLEIILPYLLDLGCYFGEVLSI